MSIRRIIKLVVSRYFASGFRDIKLVRVEWPPHPNPKMHWPDRLEIPVDRRGLRCAKVRRDIAALLGTTAFIWVGPRHVKVLKRYDLIPPQGGSGTAPARCRVDPPHSHPRPTCRMCGRTDCPSPTLTLTDDA